MSHDTFIFSSQIQNTELKVVSCIKQKLRKSFREKQMHNYRRVCNTFLAVTEHKFCKAL